MKENLETLGVVTEVNTNSDEVAIELYSDFHFKNRVLDFIGAGFSIEPTNTANHSLPEASIGQLVIHDEETNCVSNLIINPANIDKLMLIMGRHQCIVADRTINIMGDFGYGLNYSYRETESIKELSEASKSCLIAASMKRQIFEAIKKGYIEVDEVTKAYFNYKSSVETVRKKEEEKANKRVHARFERGLKYPFGEPR